MSRGEETLGRRALRRIEADAGGGAAKFPRLDLNRIHQGERRPLVAYKIEGREEIDREHAALPQLDTGVVDQKAADIARSIAQADRPMGEVCRAVDKLPREAPPSIEIDVGRDGMHQRIDDADFVER